MVQYAEIKEVGDVIKALTKDYIEVTTYERIIQILKKYKEILEGWYGDEQYHNKVEERL